MNGAAFRSHCACPLAAGDQTFRTGLLRSEFDPNVWTGCFRNRDRAWVAEVADMYPACLIGSRAVALMGIRTHRWSY
jgi:hypothetical protein